MIYVKETVTVKNDGHFSLKYKYPISLSTNNNNTYILMWHYTSVCRGYIVSDGTIKIISQGTNINVSYFYDASQQ